RSSSGVAPPKGTAARIRSPAGSLAFTSPSSAARSDRASEFHIKPLLAGNRCRERNLRPRAPQGTRQLPGVDPCSPERAVELDAVADEVEARRVRVLLRPSHQRGAAVVQHAE